MIVFVGRLPPPLNGFSYINSIMLDLINSKDTTIPYNLVYSNEKKNIYIVCNYIIKILYLVLHYIFLLIASKPKALYLGLSGSIGQLVDVLFLLPAKLFNLNVFIHHHSFSYLNKETFTSKTLLRIAKHDTHIVLCNEMKITLISKYKINSNNVHILSNATFLKPNIYCNPDKYPSISSFTIGFISNITEEKGIFDYFDVLDKLHNDGIKVNALIAGPIQDNILEKFYLRINKIDNAQYIGPVYDEEKNNFYKKIDLLLFPSKYPNEAEPVTIYEAFSFGVPVISTSRGCIRSMLENSGSYLVPEDQAFTPFAVTQIKKILSHLNSIHDIRASSLRKHIDMHQQHNQNLDFLIMEITK